MDFLRRCSENKSILRFGLSFTGPFKRSVLVGLGLTGRRIHSQHISRVLESAHSDTSTRRRAPPALGQSLGLERVSYRAVVVSISTELVCVLVSDQPSAHPSEHRTPGDGGIAASCRGTD